jgi:hypothetical protein
MGVGVYVGVGVGVGEQRDSLRSNLQSVLLSSPPRPLHMLYSCRKATGRKRNKQIGRLIMGSCCFWSLLCCSYCNGGCLLVIPTYVTYHLRYGTEDRVASLRYAISNFWADASSPSTTQLLPPSLSSQHPTPHHINNFSSFPRHLCWPS